VFKYIYIGLFEKILLFGKLREDKNILTQDTLAESHLAL